MYESLRLSSSKDGCCVRMPLKSGSSSFFGSSKLVVFIGTPSPTTGRLEKDHLLPEDTRLNLRALSTCSLEEHIFLAIMSLMTLSWTSLRVDGDFDRRRRDEHGDDAANLEETAFGETWGYGDEEVAGDGDLEIQGEEVWEEDVSLGKESCRLTFAAWAEWLRGGKLSSLDIKGLEDLSSPDNELVCPEGGGEGLVLLNAVRLELLFDREWLEETQVDKTGNGEGVVTPGMFGNWLIWPENIGSEDMPSNQGSLIMREVVRRALGSFFKSARINRIAISDIVLRVGVVKLQSSILIKTRALENRFYLKTCPSNWINV